ncbi:MAG: gamma-glutamylcyclotransferase family protein [Opitutales bacterium]
MSPSDLSVFVYGTLKPGGPYWPEFCENKVGTPVPAKIRGELYDLHVGYPGLVLRGDSWVHGYALSFKTEKDFLRLDYLEGYDPERPYSENEYIRLRVPCYSEAGDALGELWTYEISEATFARHKTTRMVDGKWPI